MAINDIDHVFHVIYEKFAENQKDKKYEERVYIGEDEFIHDLKEFVKKSEVEDKGLLISEIYRSVSEDALEISSDGKITVSPKVLRKVENKILERKEREEKLSAKNIKTENVENKIDVTKISIRDISYEQYIDLTDEEKDVLMTKAMNELGAQFGLSYTEDEAEVLRMAAEEKISMEPEKLQERNEKRKKIIFGDKKSKNNEKDEDDTIEKLYNIVSGMETELLQGKFGEIFFEDGMLNKFLFNNLLTGIKGSKEVDLSGLIYRVAREQKMGKDMADKIEAAIKELGAKKLTSQMLLYIEVKNVLAGLEPFVESMDEASPEWIAEKREHVDGLLEAFGKIASNSEYDEHMIQEVQKSRKTFFGDIRKARKTSERNVQVVNELKDGKKTREDLSESERKVIEGWQKRKIVNKPKVRKIETIGEASLDNQTGNLNDGQMQLNGSAKFVMKENKRLKQFRAKNKPSTLSQTKDFFDKVFDIQNELLEGELGQIFVCDGKFNVGFFSELIQNMKTSENVNLSPLILHAGKKVGLDAEKIYNIAQVTHNMRSDELRNNILLFIEVKAVLDSFNTFSDITPEVLKELNQRVEGLEEAFKEIKNNKEFTELSMNEETIVFNKEAKENIVAHEDTAEIVEDGIDLDDVQIGEFELDSFSAMFEDIQLEPLDEPVVEDETVDLESSSGPEVIAENNSVIHAETIDVAQPEEKVVQQVEEQAVEENVRNDIQSNLPKELTWVDRAKQGLFKVGKTISNVIKAVTDKNSSKGLFERIADAINSDNNSTSDSSSTSGTSSSAGPSVDEKPIQAPVDYLNTQFKVDVKLAAETAKAASEKQAQRRDASSELTQDEEQL